MTSDDFSRRTWARTDGGGARSLELHVLFEQLESLLTPALAAEVVYEALELAGSAPRSAEELRRFARGPLAAVLRARVGDDALELIAGVEAMTGAPRGEPPRGGLPARRPARRRAS